LRVSGKKLNPADSQIPGAVEVFKERSLDRAQLYVRRE
jgi:hypothetical protein